MAYTTIDKPTDYFNTVLYTGNGSTNAITGVGHQPDLTWIKRRNSAEGHIWIDSVRGVDKRLGSNVTSAESTVTYFTSFDTDGFTVNGTNVATNASGGTFCAWNWLADNTSGSSNTDGSITSTVSANTTSGFSVCSFTEAASAPYSFGHGLGVEPNVVIFKTRGATGNWQVYHSALSSPNSSLLQLNSTAAVNTASTWWGTINSSIVTINAGLITPNTTSIAYCFAEKKGFSKFGTYSGNSSNDGTFVYTGFKPAMVIVKCSNAVENWVMWDNKRSPFNVVNDRLFPNLTNAESTSPDICDLVSNGFKFRFGPEGSWNSSGKNYIYMAFAESPFTTSTGIPTTAR
jgi:hypothetical protein